MFTTNHFILLGSCAALIAAATILSVKCRLSSRTATIIFAVICALSEITKDMVNMEPSDFGGYVLDQDDIPLHLCSIVIFAIFFAVFTKSEETREKILSAVTVIGLIAPVLAMLIPTIGVDFAKIQVYQYFIYHAALMWFSIHLVITGQVELGKKAYLRNLLIVTALIFVLLYIDSALAVYGVNYGYLREPPMDGLPILNLDRGWFCYFIILLAIVYGSLTIVHTPFMIKEAKQKKKDKYINI